ncbi:uncharacterized protein LOC131008230 [Salvia miltiorrhiza]|uniref:uncharacterized protein LOC131008230 n=1 Tax=Salvia miltiorrhiza TaxID=226208 RepID=UPI0025ACA029|nr:uncharacterized protein LOC131008230 [Salvia miltiorrhiza]
MDSGDHLPRGEHDRSALNLPPVSNNFSPNKGGSKPHKASSSQLLPNSDFVPVGNTDDRTVEQTAKQPERTYAAAVTPRPRKPDVPAHRFQALNTSKINGVDTLMIPKEFYQQRVADFKHALIGRLILRKGIKPRMAHELKAELQRLWQVPNEWQLITMGKGYFTLKFGSMDEKKIVKKTLTQEISGGQFKLREWVPKFNPYKEASALAQVWVRIYYLPIELWHPEVISAIGRYLGSPLKIDASSAVGEVGHYARVLIEIDMSLPLREYVMIDEDDSSLYVEFSYENLPAFCTVCKITGHSIDKCRRARDRAEHVNAKGKNDPPKQDTLGNAITNKEQQKVVQQQGAAAAWQPKEVVTDQQLQDIAEETIDERDAGETEDTGDYQLESIQEIRNDISGPDLLGKILVPAKYSNNHEIVDVENVNELDKSSTETLTTGAVNDSTREMIEEVLTFKEGTIQETDLKALTLENAMKIQRLESFFKEIPKDANQAAAKRGRGRPPGSGRGRSIHTPATDSIKNRLRKSIDLGHQVHDFVVEQPDTPSIRTMHNMAAKSWAAEMEMGDTPSPDF